jgi:hypothetical protein
MKSMLLHSRFRGSVMGLLLLIPLFFFSGCVGRKEAVLVTARLGQASEQTEKLVAHLKAADAANVAGLQEFQTAFFDLQRERALDAIKLKEAVYIREIEEKTSAFLVELPVARLNFINAFAAEVNEQTKPLIEKERLIMQEVDKARKAAGEHPGDLERDLAVQKHESALLATELVRIELVAKVAQAANDRADALLSERSATIVTLAAESRAKVVASAERARTKVQAVKPLIPPLPKPGTEAYAALTAYVQAVRGSSDSFAKYLQSNSLATQSFAGSFVTGFSGSIVGAVTGALRGDVPRTAEVVREGTDIARGIYADVLADNDLNGREILAGFQHDAKKAGGQLTDLAREKAGAFLATQFPRLLAGLSSTQAAGKK